MLIRLSKKKSIMVSYIGFFLCIAVFLSCLFSSSLLLTKRDFINHRSATLAEHRTAGTEYPDLIRETLIGGQNLFFLSHSTANQRIPLRLPVPHAWISYVLLIFMGLQILHKERIGTRNRHGYFRNYLIQYIHDQDGEIYHSFLF